MQGMGNKKKETTESTRSFENEQGRNAHSDPHPQPLGWVLQKGSLPPNAQDFPF